MMGQELLAALVAGTGAAGFEPGHIRLLTSPRAPLQDCVGGFKFQFTVLGAATRDRSRSYAADFLGLMPSADFQGSLAGTKFYAPTVTIGSCSFADLVAQGRSAEDIHLLTIETGNKKIDSDAGIVPALNAVTRHAPDLFIFENLANHQVPMDYLRKLWRSGFHFAGCLVADRPKDLFAAILPGFSIPRSDLDWLVDDPAKGPCIQVHFEGQRVTDEFVDWVKAK